MSELSKDKPEKPICGRIFWHDAEVLGLSANFPVLSIAARRRWAGIRRASFWVYLHTTELRHPKSVSHGSRWALWDTGLVQPTLIRQRPKFGTFSAPLKLVILITVPRR